MQSSGVSSSKTIDQELDQLMTEVKAFLPKPKEEKHQEAVPQTKSAKRVYANVRDAFDNADQYAAHVASAMHEALRGIRAHKILEKPRSTFKLATLAGKLDPIKECLRSLDNKVFFPKYVHKQIKSFKPFEIIALSESEFHVSNSNEDLEIKSESIKKIGSKIKLSYQVRGGKIETEELSANYSWSPHVVNEATYQLALIMKRFADILKRFPIPPAVKSLDVFEEMEKVLEHMIDPRIQYYLTILKPEADKRKKLAAVKQGEPQSSTVAYVSRQLGIEPSLSSLNLQDGVSAPSLPAGQPVVSAPQVASPPEPVQTEGLRRQYSPTSSGT